MIFGQPQLLVVDLPYGDGEAEFAQQGSYCVLIAYVIIGDKFSNIT